MLFIATFVSFVSFFLLLTHVSRSTMMKLVGHKGWVDVILHLSILFLFFGTSTEGLLQAEAAGICFSLYLRLYHRLIGYSRFDWRTRKWRHFQGPWATYFLRAN
jgi:hypothetical protein